MPLTLETQVIDHDVAVIRCKGRIIHGLEAEALEAEVDRQIKIPGMVLYDIEMVVLNLGETEFIDSTGLGVLVRLYSVLRGVGGGLKLCQMPPKISKVIEVTSLTSLFPHYSSEAEAVEAFSRTDRNRDDQSEISRIKIVCVDPSKDLLASLNALLTRSGYLVFTTQYLGEAATLTKAIRPTVVLCGPGMIDVSATAGIVEQLAKNDVRLKLLQLPSDFHTADAGEAAQDLLSRLKALVAAG
jgi:anti-sigma B factor antagonist